MREFLCAEDDVTCDIHGYALHATDGTSRSVSGRGGGRLREMKPVLQQRVAEFSDASEGEGAPGTSKGHGRRHTSRVNIIHNCSV